MNSDLPLGLLELSDGSSIPGIGLASFQTSSIEETKELVKMSASKGLRFFEVAELFCNAHVVKEALFESGIPREEIYISMKMWPKSRNIGALFKSCKRTIEISGFEYIDLAIVHAPIDVENRFDQWKSLEELKKEKLVSTLGVANVNMTQLMVILKNADTLPTVFEIGVSPYNQIKDMVDFCGDSTIVVVTNEPVAKGVRSSGIDMKLLSEELDQHPEIIMARWAVTKGLSVLLPPSTVKLMEHVSQVLEPLSEEHVALLDSFDESLPTCWAPPVDDDD